MKPVKIKIQMHNQINPAKRNKSFMIKISMKLIIIMTSCSKLKMKQSKTEIKNLSRFQEIILMVNQLWRKREDQILMMMIIKKSNRKKSKKNLIFNKFKKSMIISKILIIIFIMLNGDFNISKYNKNINLIIN